MRRDQHQHREPAHVGVAPQHREPLAERGGATRPRDRVTRGPAERERRTERRDGEHDGGGQDQRARGATLGQQARGRGPGGGSEQAAGPHPAVEALRLAEGVEVAEHHPELQHGQAAEQPRPHVEGVDLERVLAAQQQPEQEGDDGPRAEQQAEPVRAARAPSAPGDLGDTDGGGGDREVHEREVRRGQPRQEERVAGRLEQRVPRERARRS